MEIVWKEPPPEAIARLSRGKHAEFAQALRENPNTWALLPGTAGRSERSLSNTAQSIRRAVLKDFAPKGAFEAVPWEGEIHVRFIGDPTPRPTAPARAALNGDGPAGGDDGVAPVVPPGVVPEVPPSVIRDWTRNNGYNVPERGRLPDQYIIAYHQAHPTRS